MNAYAGDQAKRFAANLPNRGVNRFAGAFSTAPPAAGFTTAAGAATAHSAESGFGHPALVTSHLLSAGFSSARTAPSFSSARAAFSTAKPAAGLAGSTYTGSVNRPFKAPSMAKPSNGAAHHVATIETRLTQQQRAVILNPLPPNVPHNGPGYSLPASKDDSFAVLKGLVKTEEADIAPRRPSPPKKRSSNGMQGTSSKRSKQ